MKSIVLSGFMATGKSTIGPRLAARLGVPFIDTDVVIADEAQKSVPDLWREEGEAAFRARETALVERLFSDETPRVIAFGGGTVTTKSARWLAIDRALVVTLSAAPETIAARVADLGGRPNLAVGGDPVARARELLEQRAEAYAESHLTLATDALDPDDAVDAIVALAERDPILVPLGTRTYSIDVCHDEPTRLTDAVARLAPSSVVVVTDANVQRARHAAIERALEPLALDGTRVVLPAGEQHKTLASVSTIWDAALGANVDRDALVLAVGGGVIGDLAGFAASALLRGVRFVQVPTTLLAMIDASVGGKTAFDHTAGKNLIGAFHQPSAVVIDVAHVSTLPARERCAGLAEAVKIALTSDQSLLDLLERDSEKLRAGDPAALMPVIRRAVVAKAGVVRADEREAGLRAVLNFGHTVGHALETFGGYTRWLHGEAVALGAVAELAACERMGLTPAGFAERAADLFAALGLPTRVEARELAAAWPFVAADKKRVRGSVRLPVVTAAGESRIEKVDLRRLRDAVVV